MLSKRNVVAVIFSALLGLSANLASAQHGTDEYLGIVYSPLKLDYESREWGLPTTMLQYGYRLAPDWYFEARIGMGTGSDEQMVDTGFRMRNTEVELDSLWGLFARWDGRLSPEVNTYGLFGYASGKTATTPSIPAATEAEAGLTMGLGVDFTVAEDTTLHLEYIWYGSDIAGVGFGLQFHY